MLVGFVRQFYHVSAIIDGPWEIIQRVDGMHLFLLLLAGDHSSCKWDFPHTEGPYPFPLTTFLITLDARC